MFKKSAYRKNLILHRPLISNEIESKNENYRKHFLPRFEGFKYFFQKLKNTYFKKSQIIEDINRGYGKIMSYRSMDVFSINLLWLHLLFTIFLIVIVSYIKIASIMPSPFSWRPISYKESLIVLLIALFAVLLPNIIRSRVRSHYYFRISLAVSLTIFSYIFIFLSGGSIEMHFHFFIVMAYVSVYADWRLGWIVALLAIIHTLILNLFQSNWIFFYGRNDASILAHAIPIAAMAVFTSAFCTYHRNTIISLDNVRKTLVNDLREKTIIEDYLVQSENKYRQLVDFNPIGIGEAEFNGNFKYVNDSFLKIIGYTREEFESDKINWSDVTPYEYRFIDENAIAEMRTQRTATPFEKEYVKKNGTRVSVLIGSAILDESENTYICYILDITKEKQIQNKLQGSLKEKEALLKEIHHRVKNNLQIISSLLSLQAKRIKNKRYIDIFNDSKNRIKSMAIIHEKLYKSNNLSQIDFGDYVFSLTSYLLDSYQYNTELIDLKIDIENAIYLSIEIAIPCGLIINELITNSIKHAFKNRPTGIITISMKRKGEELILIISDNGIGIQKNIDMEKVNTLGLQLVNTLVDQIDGKLDIESKRGTLFRIQFKPYINV